MARRRTTLVHRGELSGIGVTDHGLLTGLSDDDHTQYHTDARALTWLQAQNVSELSNDAGYITSISGETVTDLDGTAHRLLYIDGSGNVAELGFGTSGHVLTSNGASSAPSFQAAGGGSSLTYTTDGADFAQLLSDTDVVARSYQFGMQLAPETGQTLGGLEFWDTGYSNQHAAIITNLFTSGLTIRNNQHGGHVIIDAEDTGGVATTMIDADPDGPVGLSHDGTLQTSTVVNGFTVFSGASPNAHIRAQDTNGETGLFRKLQTSQGGHTQLYGEEDGANVQLLANDAAGSVQTLLDGDPDGAVELYFDGNPVFATTNQGAQFTATTGVAGVLEIAADTGQAIAVNMEEGIFTKAQFGYFPSTSEFTARVSDAGDNIRFYSVADGDFLIANGGDSLDLYFNDVNVASTAEQGMFLKHANPYLRFYDAAGTTFLGQFQSFSGDFYFDNQVNSGRVLFRVRDSGGTQTTILEADPDVGLGFLGTAAITKPTITGSRGGNAALASLLTALENYGLITDSST